MGAGRLHFRRYFLFLSVLGVLVPASQGLGGALAQETAPPETVPPGNYTYEEAEVGGFATGVTPEEAGLPVCKHDSTWEGFSSREDALAVPNGPDECVANPEQVIYSAGRPIPHADYHHNGWQTTEKWTGGKIEAEVLNPQVDHRSGYPFDLVAVRVLPKTPTVRWLEVGWAEVSWMGDDQEVYTYRTDEQPEPMWHFYSQYNLNHGSFYAFRSYRCAPDQCASIYWAGAWQLLDTSTVDCYTDAAGRNCYVEEFAEIYSDQGDGTPHPALGAADEIVNFRDSQLRGTGDGSWIPWTQSSVLGRDTPYEVCTSQQYTDFRVGKSGC